MVIDMANVTGIHYLRQRNNRVSPLVLDTDNTNDQTFSVKNMNRVGGPVVYARGISGGSWSAVEPGKTVHITVRGTHAMYLAIDDEYYSDYVCGRPPVEVPSKVLVGASGV